MVRVDLSGKSSSQIASARIAASRALRLIETDSSSHAADALAGFAAEGNLGSEDERLARSLVFGVLRTGLTMDYYYAPFLTRLPSKLEPVVRTLLRMAAFQHFRLSRIPDYAIGHETVELAKQIFRMKSPQVGFLNAVLRKILSSAAPRELPSGNRIADLVVRYSLPENIVRMMVDKFGIHKAMAIMESCGSEPLMIIRVNRLQVDRQGLADLLQAEGFSVRNAVLAPDGLIVEAHAEGKSLFKTTAFSDGLFYVQDEASQMVAHLVCPGTGESILDMCAAPGGKSTHMAELSGGRAMITATDLSTKRLGAVAENIERLKTPQIQVKELADVDVAGEQFDAVLVDAPCSGLGTIRRNPEIRYRVTEETLLRQQERQLDTLRQAAPHVRAGGRLIYSTCSFSNEENRDVIAHFLGEDASFSKDAALENEIRQTDGQYATWPAWPMIDGFEAVVLRKS